MKTGTIKALLGALTLSLAFLLLAGCAKPAVPSSTAEARPTAPAPTPAAATNAPVQTPPAEEELVYVPAYEVYPPTMDPLYSRCAVEKAEGVYFIRYVEDQGENYFALMRGGKDAADPVTIHAFDEDVTADWICVMDDGRAWVNTLNIWNWEEINLMEVSLETGEVLRKVPFPAEYGFIIGLFDLPDGSLGVSAAALTDGAQTVYRLEEDGTFTELTVPLDKGTFVTILGSAGSGLPEGECMAYDRKSLIAFTPGTEERRELMRWAEWGVFFGSTSPLGMKDGVVRLLDYGYGEYVTLTPTPRSQVPVRQEITMSCLTVETAVSDAVRDFNRRSGEYYITIRDYSDGQPFTRDVQDRAITAMNLDIVNGNMPDLLSVQDGVPFKSYAEKGLLRDLGPWLEGEGIELLPQLLRAGTVQEKLLMVCGSFSILTAAGNRDVLGDLQGWTVPEAEALAASAPDCAGVFTSGMTREKYLELMDSYLEGYLDWDAGTASFDSPEFRDVLAFAAALPAGEKTENTAEAEIMHGQALADAVTVTSVGDWQLRDTVYMGKLVCPGLPVSDRVGSLIKMRSPMAVSAVSAHPEGACAFLKSMLDEKTQTAYTDRFPSLKAAFESHLAEAMREPTPEEGYTVTYITADDYRFADGTVYLWDEAGGERAPRMILCWYDENYSVIREEKMYAMSEAQRDALMALLEGALRSTSYDQVIAGIVHEETGAFFAGQRDADEVSRRIQSRVLLYMSEQG